MGYKLYIRALNNTYMDNMGTHLPTSSIVPPSTPASLPLNTWGYNLDASTNFVGILTTDVLIRSIAEPASSGDITNVTYGLNLDLTNPIGTYTTSVVYTAVPQTD